MTRTRREFLHSGAAGLAGTCLAAGQLQGAPANSGPAPGKRTEAGPKGGEAAAQIQCLDYARCFLCGTAPMNNVRFWVESRTTIFDDKARSATVFYQCASCKSENTFGEKDLFVADNYDFLPIFGGGHWLIFRRPARISPNYRKTYKSTQLWGEPRLILHDAPQVTRLDTFERIREATAAGLPIVTQTEIGNSKTGLRAVIECPVKTMNISLLKKMYQVDTGPIAFPDLGKRFEALVDCLSVAFVVFNAPHFADFIIEQPTAVMEAGKEKCRVYHFSAPFSLPAKNAVLALGEM
jgi:hypothetical protein